MPWTPLPRELKVHCLRLLHASDVLACSGSCRVDFAAVDAEELWALLFQRDWRWLCADGPCNFTPSRQSHRRLAEKVGSSRAAFVVLGGCVRRDDGGRHADGVVLSVLSADDTKAPRWRSYSGLPMASRCAAGICCKGGAEVSGRLLVAGGFDFSEEQASASCESIDIADLLAERPAVQACPSLLHPRACPGLAAASEAVLAVGGGSSMFTAAEAFRSVEVLCTAATKWQYGPSLQRPRCAAGVCVTSMGHAYAISGYAGNDCYEESVEWADLASSEGLLRGWFAGASRLRSLLWSRRMRLGPGWRL
ncbi:klhl3 [Symbiodinium natans]|uniref:Klhl3 protein n=1 Tax=Symbiodinium natans TaxID=878477 RepID=A0A812IAX7_9DINO|nr:klhl3 [Symbiodinium natans]